MRDSSVHIKYLIANERDTEWGVTVNSVGFQHVEEQEPYPPRNHPTRYFFSTERGRVLNEYQLLYIIRGRGQFTSTSCRSSRVGEGNMFLLFPGEWHNYYPDPESGWDEYWIGFSGKTIDNRMENLFFDRQKPVFSVGLQQEIVQLYKQAITIARNQKTGFQQMLAGITNLLLSYAYSYDRQTSFDQMRTANSVDRAKVIIVENINNHISPEEIARQLNVSYSWFRRMFKQYTGFSPMQYITGMKIERAKELLTNTDTPSKEIAFELGFENSDYFCTLFKRKTGMTPIDYRKKSQGWELM